ncbi:kelch-like protein 17 [Uloborus diversus]|uniref:kelch-like protein 17 n=1 Tax=Uloborus diversus TaxID=327109 RepID=UPI00240A0727|nr:kelch-like protein 17 [Uloborus diversus]
MQKLSDGVVKTKDGHSFAIHRVLLFQRSDYFKALFMSNNCQRTEFVIPGIQGTTLNEILRYLYTNEIHLRDENVKDILVASDYLLLDHLVEECRIFAMQKMSVRNCLPLFIASWEVGRIHLNKECYRFVQTHFESVLHEHRSVIGELSLQALKQFLGDKSLNVSGEKAVWLAIVNWVEKDMSQRQQHIPELLTNISLEDTDEDLATEILHHDFIQKNPFCFDLHFDRNPNAFSIRKVKFLSNFIKNQPSKDFAVNNCRLPKCLYVIINYFASHNTDGIKLYLTYDQEIDLWRNIGEVRMCPDNFISIGRFLYAFASFENHYERYDLVNKEWSPMAPMTFLRHQFCVVRHDNYIYSVGGLIYDHQVTDFVEFYDPNTDVWSEATSMMAVDSCCAASVKGCIYAIGIWTDVEGERIMVQAYYPEFNTWQQMSAPNTFRRNFTLAVFDEKLYLIGGEDETGFLKTVEEYDPSSNSWRQHVDLPFAYFLPKAVLLKESLIVYDNHAEDRWYYHTNPPVQWDRSEACWKIVNVSSQLQNLHLYQFCCLEDVETIRVLMNQCRVEDVEFSKSPFSQAFLNS